MIKVAHLTASISRQGGGIFDAVLRLAQSADRQRFDERAFALRDASTDADLPKWAPIPASAYAAAGLLKPIGYAPGFAEALAEFSPDLCHTHGLWLYPSLAAKNYGKKKQTALDHLAARDARSMGHTKFPLEKTHRVGMVRRRTPPRRALPAGFVSVRGGFHP